MNTDHPVFLLLNTSGNTTKNRLDARLHLKDIERLGHIIIRAVLKTEDLIHILALCGQHDDRDIAPFTNPLADSNTVQLRKHHVQKDQIKRTRLKLGQGLFSVHGTVCLVTFLFQRIFQALQDQRFVVHQEDPFTH